MKKSSPAANKAASKIVEWVPGKMHLEPGNTYSMKGSELIDFGRYKDSDGCLIAATLTYAVTIGMPWEIHELTAK